MSIFPERDTDAAPAARVLGYLKRLVPQPLTGIFFSAAALLILGFSLSDLLLQTSTQWLSALPVVVFLVATTIVAGLYPVHIRYHAKVELTTPPLYLAALLLPPPLAALTAGISRLIVPVLMRKKRGYYASDIATASGRWVVVSYISSWVAHSFATDTVSVALALLITAIVMFALDVITCSFEIAPMSGESPLRVMRMLLREGGLLEGVQFLLGMLGALAAMQQSWALLLLVLPTGVVYMAFKNVKEMRDETRRVLEGMADAVDLRDVYTGGHSRRVAESAGRIVREMHIYGPEAELVKSAARVHDIGKIGVPDQILNKPDRLTADEKKIMDSHPELGANLLARYPDFSRGIDIVRYHHERWDGLGYPHGLKGLDIPLGARVIAVADSFDAMTSDRPYRKGMPVAMALQILNEGAGTQWDTQIVQAFLRIMDLKRDAPAKAAAEAPAKSSTNAAAVATTVTA